MSKSNRTKGVMYSSAGTAYVPPRLVESNGPNGWYIEYWVTDISTGKLVRRRYHEISGSTKVAQRKQARVHMRKIGKFLHDGATVGEGIQPKEEKPKLLMEAMEKAEQIKRKQAEREGNPAHYMHRAGVFHEWITQAGLVMLPLEQFERQHVYQFLDWLTEVREVKARTRNNYLSYVRMACNVLIERGILDRNPTKGIGFARTEGKRHVPFTKDQQSQLEKWMMQHDPDLYRFTRMIYYGFIRRVEVLRLKVGQVSLENGIILVWSGNSKNKQQMPVVITPGMQRILEEMLADNPPSGWYLFGRQMQPGPNKWHPNRVSERHRAALEACEIDTQVHDLYGWKHTGVCAAYRAGVDIYSIMRQCRHSNLNETENYMRSMGLRISSELKSVEW